jgi:energy-coupling factor transporter ATP-binding protein EcfA2
VDSKWIWSDEAMLKTFKVESFKSLENVEVELGRVNVFIGANGSGKSNLLEAIGVLGAAANGRVDDEALLRRGVRPGLPVLYKSSFKGSRQPQDIRFSASNEGASFSVGLFNPLEKPEPAWRFDSELLEEEGKEPIDRDSAAKKFQLDPTAGYIALKAVEFPQKSLAGRLLKELRQFAIYSPDTATLRGLDTDPQNREPVGLSGGRLAEAVNDVFQIRHLGNEHDLYFSVLELIDWSRKFGMAGPKAVPISKNIPQPIMVLQFWDRYMAEGRSILSGYDASEGALYVLFMTVLVHHHQSPPVLAVDNFDHALNPRLAKALTRKLCDWITARQDRQLLLTSHNPLVLDGLPLRNDAVRLFTVERSNKGKTVVRRVEVSAELLDMAEKGVPLSQQWVMGTFGGVPDI